jgi:hypothetical protein
MTQKHPITPSPELVQQWEEDWHHSKIKHIELEPYIATQAAQWGADQELLACGNYLKQCAAWEEEDVTEFYNYRRPKPPSLKEQALQALTEADLGSTEADWSQRYDTIRRALEQLPD